MGAGDVLRRSGTPIYTTEKRSSMNIDISKIWPGWTITERLGHGGFGHVYKVISAETDAVAAVKIISIPDNNDITYYVM